MKKKNAPKNARRADGVLSPEELAKAIEEYKARRAQRLAAKTDEDPTEGTDPVVSAKPTNAPAAAQDDDDTVVAPAGQEPQTVEDKVAAVKDNRDRRDADGDPEDLESAKGVIANQDEDMDILFDIIDTLLAQKEFDEAGCTDPQTDEGDDTTDENNDEGDDTDNQDSDDDAIPTATPADHTQGEVLNADGIDAIIRQRVKIGMIGSAIIDDEACREASKQEIIRRYFATACNVKKGLAEPSELHKQEMLMNYLHLTPDMRPCVPAARKKAEETGAPAAAIELPDGRIVTGKTSGLMGACSAALLNSLKTLAGIHDRVNLIAPMVLAPIQHLKVEHLGNSNPRLHTDEVLIALSMSAVTNPTAEMAMEALSGLRGGEVHSSVILSSVDENTFKKLGMHVTYEPVYQSHALYHK